MNGDIKRRWVEALRSGEYKQGRGVLARYGEEAEYCCLGVLCDLAVKDGVIEVTPYGGRLVFDGSEDVLPASVRDWAGLRAAAPTVSDGRGLAELNDGNETGGLERHTFEQIAALIEAQPEGWEGIHEDEEIPAPF